MGSEEKEKKRERRAGGGDSEREWESGPVLKLID